MSSILGNNIPRGILYRLIPGGVRLNALHVHITDIVYKHTPPQITMII